MNLTHYVGIDNSHLSHSVVIIDQSGSIVQHFFIENSLKGFNVLNSRLSSFGACAIGCEIAHGPLIDYLRIKSLNWYSINPLMVKRFKETHTVSKNKNDYIDALAIAQYLKENLSILHPFIPSSEEIEELKHLCTIHDQLTAEHKRLTLQLLDTLKRYFPLLSDLFSSSTLPILYHFILQYPTWGDLKRTPEEEFKKFMFKHHYPGKDITRLIARIRDYDQSIVPVVEHAYSLNSCILATNILVVKKGLKGIEEKMGIIAQKHPLGKVFYSIPGSGAKLAPKLLAIFGDNKDAFRTANCAQCYFGTAPRNYQSGKIRRVIMRRACNKQGRNILFQLAFSSMLRSSWARKYYDMQRSKGKSHSIAVRALSNKWTKILWYLWMREECYSEERRSSLSNVA